MVQVHAYRICADRVAEFLLLKRSAHERAYPNVWQCITGGIEPGESSTEAAARELFEETGLHAIKWHVLPNVSMFYSALRDHIVLSPTFGCEVQLTTDPILSDEHSEFVWLRLTDAIDRSIFPSQKDGISAVHELLVAQGTAAM